MLEELVNGRALAGFNRHGQGGVRLELAAKFLPALQGVLEAEFGDDLSLTVHDDHIVMIPRPVKTRAVGCFIPRFHGFPWGCAHRRAVVSHPDTRSLGGYGSLRPVDSRHRTVR